jgi:hypothetical protein
MPEVKWSKPRYGNYEIVEMQSVAPREDHEVDYIREAPEHVLLLGKRETHRGRTDWCAAWVLPHPEIGWHEVFSYLGPSANNGDDLRKMLRDRKEQITGVMS